MAQGCSPIRLRTRQCSHPSLHLPPGQPSTRLIAVSQWTIHLFPAEVARSYRLMRYLKALCSSDAYPHRRPHVVHSRCLPRALDEYRDGHFGAPARPHPPECADVRASLRWRRNPAIVPSFYDSIHMSTVRSHECRDNFRFVPGPGSFRKRWLSAIIHETRSVASAAGAGQKISVLHTERKSCARCRGKRMQDHLVIMRTLSGLLAALGPRLWCRHVTKER